MTQRFRRTSAVLIAGAILAVSACGSGSSDDTGSADEPPAPAPASTQAPAPAVLEVSAALQSSGDQLPPLEDPTNDPAVGRAAPVVTGQRFDGESITIGEPTDGPTMLVFLAHWCPHCNDEIPEITALRDRGDLPSDLNVVGVSTAVVEERDNYPPSAWVVEKDWTWPVLADTAGSDAIQIFGGSGFPFTVMLDSDGTVLGRKSGTGTADEIQAWISSLIQRA